MSYFRHTCTYIHKHMHRKGETLFNNIKVTVCAEEIELIFLFFFFILWPREPEREVNRISFEKFARCLSTEPSAFAATVEVHSEVKDALAITTGRWPQQTRTITELWRSSRAVSFRWTGETRGRRQTGRPLHGQDSDGPALWCLTHLLCPFPHENSTSENAAALHLFMNQGLITKLRLSPQTLGCSRQRRLAREVWCSVHTLIRFRRSSTVLSCHLVKEKTEHDTKTFSEPQNLISVFFSATKSHRHRVNGKGAVTHCDHYYNYHWYGFKSNPSIGKRSRLDLNGSSHAVHRQQESTATRAKLQEQCLLWDITI